MTAETIALVARVASCSRELEAIVRDDTEFYEEVLPHVFFGDISRWAVKVAAAGDEGGELASVIAVLEIEYEAGDQEVKDVIGASFIENTWDDVRVRSLYGPVLRRAADLGS